MLPSHKSSRNSLAMSKHIHKTKRVHGAFFAHLATMATAIWRGGPEQKARVYLYSAARVVSQV